jgi:hypothetical protein
MINTRVYIVNTGLYGINTSVFAITRVYMINLMSIWSTWVSIWSTQASMWLIWLSIGSTQESIWSIQASTWSTQASKWPNWMSLRQCECLHINVGVSVSTWVSTCICNVKVIIFECPSCLNHSKISKTLKIAMAIQTTRDLDSGMATLFWVACIHILIRENNVYYAS